MCYNRDTPDTGQACGWDKSVLIYIVHFSIISCSGKQKYSSPKLKILVLQIKPITLFRRCITGHCHLVKRFSLLAKHHLPYSMLKPLGKNGILYRGMLILKFVLFWHPLFKSEWTWLTVFLDKGKAGLIYVHVFLTDTTSTSLDLKTALVILPRSCGRKPRN